MSKAAPKKATEDPAEARKAQLVLRAIANPNEFFPFEECGLILGFGRNAMTALNRAGAPQAFRKMNPAMVREWIAKNQELIGKIRGSDE